MDNEEDKNPDQPKEGQQNPNPINSAQQAFNTGRNIGQGINAARHSGEQNHADEGLHGGENKPKNPEKVPKKSPNKTPGRGGGLLKKTGGAFGALATSRMNSQNQDEPGQKRKKGAVDQINDVYKTAKNVNRGIKVAQLALRGAATAIRAASMFTNPFFITFAIIFILIILVILLDGGSSLSGGGGSGDTSETPRDSLVGDQTGGAVCGGTGSLDYSVAIRDHSILPQNPVALQEEILASWPGAQIFSWDHIVSRSIQEGWNPSFILALWVEESGAQGASGYTDALGCDPGNPTTDINKSLNCVFNSFRWMTNDDFENFMCIYGGDGFHNAPCSFNTQNPNFPGNVKNWYQKIAGGVQEVSTDVTACGNESPGDWPTTGIVTQGPLGATSHLRLNNIDGREAIDIGNLYGTSPPPILSGFDGEVIDVYDCVFNQSCSSSYGNFVIVRSNGAGPSILYGHLSEILVNLNQAVTSGQQIGIMGTTGNSSGVHLHYEFRGAGMIPPYIPTSIEPRDCDSAASCNLQIAPGALAPGV